MNLYKIIKDWLWCKGHPLNAFADVLWHFARFGTHGVVDIPEWLSDSITRWANVVLEVPAAQARTSLREFVVRAQGFTSDSESIRWNPDIKQFEAIPWSLKKRSLNNLPSQAIMISDHTRKGIPLKKLWVAAKKSGYHVLENRSFKGPLDQDIWFCTLQVQAESTNKIKPILSIWQKRGHAHRSFYLTEECSLEEMRQPIRRWIDLVRKCGESRDDSVLI